jgi:hypothetical protein
MIKFKIKPSGNRFFFRVILFDTKEQMRAWWAEYDKKFYGGGYNGEKFGAMTIPYESWKGDNMESEIGTIIFAKEQLGAGTVAHEMGHAAIWYDRLINGNVNAEYGQSIGEEEERMLYVLADLVKQTINKFFKLKVY